MAELKPKSSLPRFAWTPYWVLLHVALWPFPAIAEAVLSLGVCAFLVIWIKHQCRIPTSLINGQMWALSCVLFCAYWLPQLFSSIGGISPDQTVLKTLKSLRYLPFLWAVMMSVSQPTYRKTTFNGLGILVLVWAVDAWLEVLTGKSALFLLFSEIRWGVTQTALCSVTSAEIGRLSGFLGPCNVKLGIILASMSPFALFFAARRYGKWGWIISTLLLLGIIILAGARAAWFTYILVILLSGFSLLNKKEIIGFSILSGILAIAVILFSPAVQQRLEQTWLAFSQQEKGLDTAISGRGQIWQAALCMVEKHPINGVGVRNFRYAFAECDPYQGKGGAWGQDPALHAHQIVLEILSETGILGLLLWLAGAAMAWRAWRFSSAEEKYHAQPAAYALLVTIFPFNTHLAFYSTFWGGLTLLLTGLFVGSLLGQNDKNLKKLDEDLDNPTAFLDKLEQVSDNSSRAVSN